MKSKFEKEFKNKAYKEVPDKWEDVKEKANIKETEKKTRIISFNKRAVVSAVASVAIVIVAVAVAITQKDGGNLPVTEEIPTENTAIVSENKSKNTKMSEEEYLTDNEAITNPRENETGKEKPIETKPQETENKTSTTDRTTTVTIPATTQIKNTTTAEIVTEPDWSIRSMPGKFPAVQINGREYSYPFSRRESITTDRKATLILSGRTLTNINSQTDKKETAVADIYSLEGFSEELAVGVRFKDGKETYIYVNNSYYPASLEEFLAATDYNNTVTYGGISLYFRGSFPVNAQNASDIRKYLLSGGSAEDAGTSPSGNVVTVTISCEELGRNGKYLEIYESGHIATNLIGYRYVFFVGKNAVKEFVENSYNITFEEIQSINDFNRSTNHCTDIKNWTDVSAMTTKAYIPE